MFKKRIFKKAQEDQTIGYKKFIYIVLGVILAFLLYWMIQKAYSSVFS